MSLPAPAGKLGLAVTWVSGLLKSHEWLLAIVLGFGLIWGVTGKVQTVIANHDQKVFDAKNAVLQATAEKNAAIAQSNATLATHFAQDAAQALQDKVALQAANDALTAALAKQKATDATLPPPALATRIEAVAKLPDGAITAKPDNTLAFTLPAAVEVAQMLEEVPVLQTQLSNTDAQKAADEKLLGEQTTIVAGLNNQIGGLQLQQKQSDAACDARVQVQKDATAKARRAGFKVGYIAGWASAIAAKIASHFL